METKSLLQSGGSPIRIGLCSCHLLLEFHLQSTVPIGISLCPCVAQGTLLSPPVLCRS